MMKKTDWDYIVIALLALASLYLLLTGLIMDRMGLHHLAGHSWVGYVWAILSGLHLGLSWGRVQAYWTHRLRTPAGSPRQAHPEPAPVQQPPTERGRRSWLASVLAMAGGFWLGRFLALRGAAGLSESGQDMGSVYHQWSQLGYKQALTSLLTPGKPPERYKIYPQAQQVQLPPWGGDQGMSLKVAIETRHSQRHYTGESLSLASLSRLLYWGQGLTRPETEKRAAPSAGALYPLELYLAAHRVEGLPAGIYHYAVRGHRLEMLKLGDFRAALVAAGLGQDFLGQASACFMLSAIWQRTRWKYHERTYRYVLMEAGHLAQNLYLGATALGLGVCAVGAFLDEALNDLLLLDGQEEAALYLIAVGAASD